MLIRRLLLSLLLLGANHLLQGQSTGEKAFIRVEGRTCVDSTLNFMVAGAEGATSWSWELGEGTSSGSETPRHSFTEPGTYQVKARFVDATARPDSAQLDLTVYNCQDRTCEADAYMEIGFEGAPCFPDSINFFPVTTLGLRFYEWRWGEELLTYRREGKLVFDEAEAADLTLKGIDTLGCSYRAFVDLDIRSCVLQCEDSLRIEYDGINCAGELLSFSAESSAELEHWSWEFSNGVFSSAAEPALSFAAGSYEVFLTVNSVDGCSYSISKELVIAESCTDLCALGMPNAFSPNNDGLNDFFGPLNSCDLNAFRLLIFDRWGNLVFESRDPGRHWDGARDGRALPAGEYAWMVRYQPIGRIEERVDSGTILLLR